MLVKGAQVSAIDAPAIPTGATEALKLLCCWLTLPFKLSIVDVTDIRLNYFSYKLT